MLINGVQKYGLKNRKGMHDIIKIWIILLFVLIYILDIFM